jgi:hypothetical protein
MSEDHIHTVPAVQRLGGQMTSDEVRQIFVRVLSKEFGKWVAFSPVIYDVLDGLNAEGVFVVPSPSLVNLNIYHSAWEGGAREAILNAINRVNLIPIGATKNSCWDNHNGPGASHADGSTCMNKEEVWISRDKVITEIRAGLRGSDINE